MGILKVITKAEAENIYLAHSLLYVTGKHTIPGYYGGINICPENAYEQMMAVKRYFGKTSGNQLVHFVISFNNSFYGEDEILGLGYRIGQYFGDRYQLVFGVHHKVNHARNGTVSSYNHLHIIMNSVSFLDGKMYADNKGDTYKFVDFLKSITKDKHWKVVYGVDDKD